jgi:hypothetical protein
VSKGQEGHRGDQRDRRNPQQLLHCNRPRRCVPTCPYVFQQAADLGGRAGLVADIERVMSAAREGAEQEAAEIRRRAEREAAEVRAVVREAEACYEEISRHAEQLHRIEARLRDQLHALEHVVAEGRLTLAGVPEHNGAVGSAAVG